MTLSTAYRAALRLYPGEIRREYGDDMVALFEAQLRDETRLRVAGRTLFDLLLTIPTQHLEVHMSQRSTTPIVIGLAALGAALAIVGGVVGAAVAVAAFALAGLLWSRSRPIVTEPSARWWKLLLGGAALLVSVIAVLTFNGEVTNRGWYVAMSIGATALVLMAAGLVLGAACRFRTS